MLGGFEARQIGAHFGQYLEGGGDVDPIDLGQIHAAQLKQIGPHVEPGCVLRPRPSFRFARFSAMARQGRQHGFQLPVAFGQFGRIGVIQRHRLLEREEVFLPPVTLQGFGDLLLSGPNAEVLELGQHLPVAFARQARPDDSLTRLPTTSGITWAN